MMFWTDAERSGLKAMGSSIKQKQCWLMEDMGTGAQQFSSGLVSAAKDTTRSYVRAARAVKERERSNRVDVSNLKPWMGRGRIEMATCSHFIQTVTGWASCYVGGPHDFECLFGCTKQAEQDRED